MNDVLSATLLRRPVGLGRSNDRDDIRTLKTMLHRIGRLPEPEESFSGDFDTPLEKAVTGFQRDNGLDVDGRLVPGGETERALRRSVRNSPPAFAVRPGELTLSGRIGAGGDPAAEGTGAVARTLANLGFLAPRKAAEIGRGDGKARLVLENAVRDFQMSEALDPDGRLEPGGPTVTALKRAASNQMSGGEGGGEIKGDAGDDRLERGENFAEEAEGTKPSTSQDGNMEVASADDAAAPDSGNRPVQVAQAAGSRVTLKDRSKPLIGVPSYKKDLFPSSDESWRNWSNHVRDLPGVSENEARAYAEIFAAEGGLGLDPRTRNVASGITPGVLAVKEVRKELEAAGVDISRGPRGIPVEDRPKVYRAYMNYALNRAGGVRALDSLASGETSAAVADTLFRHGRTGGAKIIVTAINDIRPGSLPPDGSVVGPATLPILQKMAQNPGDRAKLLDAIAAQRRLRVRNPNERARFDHFRFQKSP